MSNYENNKKIQYIDFLKLVEIEVLTITSIIAVYYLFIVIGVNILCFVYYSFNTKIKKEQWNG